MREYKVVIGNGSTYNHVAEYMEHHGKFFHFMVDGKTVGITSDYGVVSISDQPYNQRFV